MSLEDDRLVFRGFERFRIMSKDNTKRMNRRMLMKENIDDVCQQNCLKYLNVNVIHDGIDREQKIHSDCEELSATATDALGIKTYCPLGYGVYVNDDGKQFLVHPKKLYLSRAR